MVAEKTSPVNYRIEPLSGEKPLRIVYVERLKPFTVRKDDDDTVFWKHADVSVNDPLETFTETDLPQPEETITAVEETVEHQTCGHNAPGLNRYVILTAV